MFCMAVPSSACPFIHTSLSFFTWHNLASWHCNEYQRTIDQSSLFTSQDLGANKVWVKHHYSWAAFFPSHLFYSGINGQGEDKWQWERNGHWLNSIENINVDGKYWLLTINMPIAAINHKLHWHFCQCPAVNLTFQSPTHYSIACHRCSLFVLSLGLVLWNTALHSLTCWVCYC